MLTSAVVIQLYVYIIFSIFFSIIVYHRILSVVPYAVGP